MPLALFVFVFHADCTILPDARAKRRVPGPICPGKPRIFPQTARPGAGTPTALSWLHTLQTGASNQTVNNLMKTMFALLSILVLFIFTGCGNAPQEGADTLAPPAASAPKAVDTNLPAAPYSPVVTNSPASTNTPM